MSELKTLKDLRLERADTRINDILRAEAVECAKYFEKMMLEAESCDEEPQHFHYWKGRFDEVMERFDLTEEDMK